MGLPDNIPFYMIVGAAIAFPVHDAYRWTLHKTSKAYDYLEDRVDDVSEFMTTASDTIMYQTGLSATSQAAKTFPKFRNLPAEIRCQIWNCALPGPRIINVRKIVSGSEEALKTYELSFGTQYAPSKFYIDFTRDTIYFGSMQSLFDIRDIHRFVASENGRPFQGLEKVRSVALRSRNFVDVSSFLFGEFKGLEEVILVGERHFELGPGPNLRIEGIDGTLLILPNVSRHMEDLVKRSQIWKERHPNWNAPLLKKGIFEKGKEDRWYCEGRGRSKFG